MSGCKASTKIDQVASEIGLEKQNLPACVLSQQICQISRSVDGSLLI